jgi:hypothetical protein
MTMTSQPSRWAGLLSVGDQRPDDEEFLARIRQRIAAPAASSSSVSIVELFDRLVRRLKSGSDPVEGRIRRLIEQAPPLTSEQRERLSALLSGFAVA